MTPCALPVFAARGDRVQGERPRPARALVVHADAWQIFEMEVLNSYFRGAAQAHRAARRGAEPAEPAGRLSLPSALPDPRSAAVQHQGPAAREEARRALGGVPFE